VYIMGIGFSCLLTSASLSQRIWIVGWAKPKPASWNCSIRLRSGNSY